LLSFYAALDKQLKNIARDFREFLKVLKHSEKKNLMIKDK
jgi:hypothetical protein